MFHRTLSLSLPLYLSLSLPLTQYLVSDKGDSLKVENEANNDGGGGSSEFTRE